jgi:protein-tyrosine-phosphatase
MPSVIILCSANSIRSPLAEGLWRQLASESNSEWHVESAGALGAGHLHPLTQQVLGEVGAALDDFESRSVSEVRGVFDLAVILSEEAYERFPEVPLAKRTLYWPMPDPTADPTQNRLGAFRALREELCLAIRQFLNAKHVWD